MNYFAIPGIPKRSEHLTCKDVIEAAAEAAGIPINQLLSRSRKRHIVKHRQVAMYICCREISPPPYLKEIGMAFTTTDGRKYDHATVIHNRDTIQFQLGAYEDVAAIYKNINRKLCS